VFALGRRNGAGGSTGATAEHAGTIRLEPLTYDEYRSLKYFPALDAMRAYGMLMVISAHMTDTVQSLTPAAAKGLTFFFVMSGFLITTLLLREEEVRGRISLAAFYIRRVCRIFPLYYLVLGTYVVLILGLGWEHAKAAGVRWALPYYLTYTNEFTIGRWHQQLFFHQSWSLGVEEKYYLLWPLIAFILLRGRMRTRVLVTGVGALALLGLATPGSWPNWYGPILVGCLMAFLLHSRAAYDRLRILGTKRWNLPIALVLLTLTVSTPWIDAAVVHVYAPLLAVFLAGAMIGALPYLGFLRFRPALSVGKLAYGMYLIHLLAINVAEAVFKPGGNIVAAITAYVLAVALSIAGAAVLHVVVEQPMIEVGRRWSTRRTAGMARVERMGAQAAP
jgi:peptidoglycan/LPS O-acetylase OafA/YrhL